MNRPIDNMCMGLGALVGFLLPGAFGLNWSACFLGGVAGLVFGAYAATQREG